MPKVREGLAPVQQPEEEKARVLKPEQSYTKQPKTESVRIRPTESTMTEEERKQRARERMQARHKAKAEAKADLIESRQGRCKDLLRFISNLKWQNNSIGQGHIIKWNSNEHYKEIEGILVECLGLVDEMTKEQLQKYEEFLQRKADEEVYKYPDEMLTTRYQYDERGLSNGAVGKAQENMSQCRTEAYYILTLEFMEEPEPYEVDVDVIDEENPFEPTDQPMGVD